MHPCIAVYDACVLHPQFLRSFLIHLAVAGLNSGRMRAKWTGQIHREWIRSVRRRYPDLDLGRLNRTRRLMDQHIRGCRVRGYRRWEPRLTLPDPNDRHVLAAALACIADVIVTFNTRDFPDSVLAPFGMAAVQPDDFAMSLFDSGMVLDTAKQQLAAMRRPAVSVEEYLALLRHNRMPTTADALLAAGLSA